ncbi:MAG: DUF447 family protein [Nitrososphaerota archaeon]|nr:DUF447 family protein [Candidatus Geocrenenecus dongiae]
MHKASVKEVMPTILPQVIYEVIITSTSVNGEVNAAPFGIKFLDTELTRFSIKIYKDSKTFKNLYETRIGIVNITRKIEPFLTFMGREKNKHLLDRLEKSKTINVPRLKDMEAYIEFTVDNILEKDIYGEFNCSVLDCYLGKTFIEPICRGSYAMIEVAVYLSKVEPYIKQGKYIIELEEAVKHSLKIALKTIPREVLEEYVNILYSVLSEQTSSVLKKCLLQLESRL